MFRKVHKRYSSFFLIPLWILADFQSSLKHFDIFQTGCWNQRSQVLHGCVVTSKYMVEPKDPNRVFDKADYYSNPEDYFTIFHERVAPYASVIVNCMYWERLTTKQLQDVTKRRCPLIGIADITCDIGGSIEFVNQATTIDSPFFRSDPHTKSYHNDIEGNCVICSAVDILPPEFPKEASQHFGNILWEFIGHLASAKDFGELPPHLKKACIVHRGALTPLYEYMPRVRDYKLPQNLPDSYPVKNIHTQEEETLGRSYNTNLSLQL